MQIWTILYLIHIGISINIDFPSLIERFIIILFITIFYFRFCWYDVQIEAYMWAMHLFKIFKKLIHWSSIWGCSRSVSAPIRNYLFLRIRIRNNWVLIWGSGSGMINFGSRTLHIIWGLSYISSGQCVMQAFFKLSFAVWS